MGITGPEFEMYAMIPINSKNTNDAAFMDIINKYGNPEIAVRLNDSSKFKINFWYNFFIYRFEPKKYRRHLNLQRKDATYA